MGAFLVIVAIGGADGGYFPTTWNWSAIALGWVAGLALILRARVTADRLELALLGSLVLLVGWVALSIGWSSDVEGSVLEVQRGLVYVVAVLAALLVVRRGSTAHLLAGLVAAITWLSIRALSTRLWSAPTGVSLDEVSPGRLADPIGYWNALGLLAVIGALLALAFAAHGRHAAGRVAAAAVLPILLTTAYFTYSRGAVLALVVGLVAAIAFDVRRAALLTTGALVAVPSAIAVWLASRAPALNSATAARDAVLAQGHELAVALLALTAASAVMAPAATALLARTPSRGRVRPVVATAFARRVRGGRGAPGAGVTALGRRGRRACAVAIACAAVALVVGAVVDHGGGPGAVAAAAQRGFDADMPSSHEPGALGSRLGSLANSSRVDHWRAAWREHEQHPWVGSGAGTYEQFWLRYRPVDDSVRDAHSIYLETLAELGWPGLLLLVTMLALPFAAARRARAQPLLAGAFGAYAAFVVHAGLDWDWEMPVVTVLALLCAVALLASREDGAVARVPIGAGHRALAVAATIAVVAFSAIASVSNRALASASERVDAGELRAAQHDARLALRWAPWSSQAQIVLGRARVGLGRRAEGRATLLEATRTTPGDWQAWYELGIASDGVARERAFTRAAALNPVGEDIAVLRERGQLPGGPR